MRILWTVLACQTAPLQGSVGLLPFTHSIWAVAMCTQAECPIFLTFASGDSPVFCHLLRQLWTTVGFTLPGQTFTDCRFSPGGKSKVQDLTMPARIWFRGFCLIVYLIGLMLMTMMKET